LILSPPRECVMLPLQFGPKVRPIVVHKREAQKGGGGELVQGSFEEQIVLTCGDCGEKMVVFGPEEDWRARHAVFVCGHGHRLTLDGPADEKILVAS
jgi:hypothetical protein